MTLATLPQRSSHAVAHIMRTMAPLLLMGAPRPNRSEGKLATGIYTSTTVTGNNTGSTVSTTAEAP
jgi:hypothetical protein